MARRQRVNSENRLPARDLVLLVVRGCKERFDHAGAGGAQAR